MKIPNGNVSAFEIYSKRFSQKKKPKLTETNRVNKTKKKRVAQNNELKKQLLVESITDTIQGAVGNPSKTCSIKSLNGSKSAKKSKSEKNFKKLQETDNKLDSNITPIKRQIKVQNKHTRQDNEKQISDVLKIEEVADATKIPKKKKKLMNSLENKKDQVVEKQISDVLNIEKVADTTKIKKKKKKLINSLDNKKDQVIKKQISDVLNIGKVADTTKITKKKKKLMNSLENKKDQVIVSASPEEQLIHQPMLDKPIIQDTYKGTKINPLMDNKVTSIQVFENIISPITEPQFLNEIWEMKPLYIRGTEQKKNFFQDLISTPTIDRMLRRCVVQFVEHLDLTKYDDGKKYITAKEGRAQCNIVWDHYCAGFSVRLRNPQSFLANVLNLNSKLQEYFNCFVGANAYLTPPNSQGFAPHFDDIEAFVLQIEGKKRWRLYRPRSKSEELPRFSSPDLPEELLGEPEIDAVLEPGDVLYFPRGWIHQANTIDNEHSLHLTVSAYQKTAWVDLLEKALPMALNMATSENIELRRGLPLDYLELEHNNNQWSLFQNDAMDLMPMITRCLPRCLGSAVDLMGKQFMVDALPPVLTEYENTTCTYGSGLIMQENGNVVHRIPFSLKTPIRLLKKNICRVVLEENETRLYHHIDNSLFYHGREPQFLVLPDKGASIFKRLYSSYPDFITIDKFLHVFKEKALLALMEDLWDTGILMVEGSYLQSHSWKDY